jgi:hypothetical protein
MAPGAGRAWRAHSHRTRLAEKEPVILDRRRLGAANLRQPLKPLKRDLADRRLALRRLRLGRQLLSDVVLEPSIAATRPSRVPRYVGSCLHGCRIHRVDGACAKQFT